MLSTLASKSGVFGRHVATIQRCLPRLASTDVATREDKQATMAKVASMKANMQEMMDTWAKANELYYGKERDTKNFPILKAPETIPEKQFILFPKSWGDALYSKTGVSGPYLLMTGVVTTLLSKEYIVIEDTFFESVIAIATGVYVYQKYMKKMIEPWIQKELARDEYRRYTKPIADVKAYVSNEINKFENAKDAIDATKDFVAAEKENIQLQLEAIYRERMDQVYKDVKRRLDYKVEVENAQRQFEQDQMVNWIVNNVVKSITAKEEKESLTSCIANLKRMSQAQAV